MSAKKEHTFSPDIKAVDGQVWIYLPAVDGYLRMSLDMAMTFATRIIQQAEIAQGNKPSHLFVIPVSDPKAKL